MEIPLLKDKDGYLLKVFVKTQVKITKIEVIDGDVLKLSLTSQPHNQMANRELIERLSEILNIPKSRIEIIKGKKSRYKIVKVKGELI